jgi:hypothetical protein
MADEHRGGKGKVARSEALRRLDFVEDRLAAFVPYSELFEQFKKEFGKGQRTVERYIQRVHARWAMEAPPAREAKRAEIERAANLTFRMARAAGNTKSMLGALELKAKLHGLYRSEDAEGDGGSLTVVFECEPAPAAASADGAAADGAEADGVPAAADVAPGRDPAGDGTVPGAGGG